MRLIVDAGLPVAVSSMSRSNLATRLDATGASWVDAGAASLKGIGEAVPVARLLPC
jgi:hypothetical protein